MKSEKKEQSLKLVAANSLTITVTLKVKSSDFRVFMTLNENHENEMGSVSTASITVKVLGNLRIMVC